MRALLPAVLGLFGVGCIGASESRGAAPAMAPSGSDAALVTEQESARVSDGCSGLVDVSEERTDARLDEARTAFRAGATAFGEGRYDAALDAFCRAYRAVPAAAVLYDIGVTYDRLGLADEAATFYERYADGKEVGYPAREARERARALRAHP